MRMRFLVALGVLDCVLLLATFHVLRFCLEWLSLRQRWVERGVIAGYLVSFWFHDPSRGTGKAFWTIFLLLALWFEHARSPELRTVKFFSNVWAVLRTSFALWCFSMFVVLAIGSRSLREDWTAPWTSLLIVVLHYMTSLPETGTKGRRRKLALDKVKELFGTSWMPQPEGAR